MSEYVRFKVLGLQALDKQLKEIGEAFRWKVLRKAMKAALLPVQVQAVAGYMGISRNLALQLKMYSSTKYQSVQVGWKWPKKLTEKRIAKYLESATRPAYYSLYVESGFDHRGGKKVPGKRILANAFDAQEAKIIERFRKSVDKSVASATNGRPRG